MSAAKGASQEPFNVKTCNPHGRIRVVGYKPTIRCSCGRPLTVDDVHNRPYSLTCNTCAKVKVHHV